MSTSASAPGSPCVTSNDIKDFVGPEICEGEGGPDWRIRKRVVLSALSSIHSARISRPEVEAAREEAIATLVPLVSPLTISALLLVLLSSLLSTPFKYAPRKTSHCPYACGCVYICRICLRLTSGFARGARGEGTEGVGVDWPDVEGERVEVAVDGGGRPRRKWWMER